MVVNLLLKPDTFVIWKPFCIPPDFKCPPPKKNITIMTFLFFPSYTPVRTAFFVFIIHYTKQFVFMVTTLINKYKHKASYFQKVSNTII